MIYHKGIVTFVILVLLSSGLTLFMLLNDDILHWHLSAFHQRKLDVQQMLALQRQNEEKKRHLCKHISSTSSENRRQVAFRLVEGKANYVWCLCRALFKVQPRQALNIGKLAYFIQREYRDLFSHQFSVQQAPYFYWFDAKQTSWTLTQNIEAIIIAEGDLHIHGKGKIKGTIVTGGRLTLEPSVQVSYHKATVAHWVTQLRDWQLAEKSWHDFLL
ncbi:DUF2572 family protein [Pasteurella multocida]|uniref:DUF2572 family protein n=1 Tax=Pasteurella multocida TaxID=747 RepID=UPI0020251831|nr:DUF2572 family protein [Pasteurella multocida]MDT8768242.1 DUF2572 family protein [Pasteurella multocida]URJ87615.1 DUF2572 family protein [Pasteurella multocida]URJ89608.1 DUF2572 family protein [Pasteurella multocida]HDR0619299.1 DUF2572 family protein [Pasteurella multocida]